jgi:hypothetical protein
MPTCHWIVVLNERLYLDEICHWWSYTQDDRYLVSFDLTNEKVWVK